MLPCLLAWPVKTEHNREAPSHECRTMPRTLTSEVFYTAIRIVTHPYRRVLMQRVKHSSHNSLKAQTSKGPVGLQTLERFTVNATSRSWDCTFRQQKGFNFPWPSNLKSLTHVLDKDFSSYRYQFQFYSHVKCTSARINKNRFSSLFFVL